MSSLQGYQPVYAQRPFESKVRQPSRASRITLACAGGLRLGHEFVHFFKILMWLSNDLDSDYRAYMGMPWGFLPCSVLIFIFFLNGMALDRAHTSAKAEMSQDCKG